LRFYRAAGASLHHLNENTQVPAIFEGRVVRIIRDFLGQSVFVIHEAVARGQNHLYTVYGHTTPQPNLRVGSMVAGGEVIGTIAAGRSVPCHLHVSVAWVPGTLPLDDLDWSTMADTRIVTLIDPLSVIKVPYSILEHL